MQDDVNGSSSCGHRGVDRDANLAMAGFLLRGMGVRDTQGRSEENHEGAHERNKGARATSRGAHDRAQCGVVSAQIRILRLVFQDSCLLY